MVHIPDKLKPIRERELEKVYAIEIFVFLGFGYTKTALKLHWMTLSGLLVLLLPEKDPLLVIFFNVWYPASKKRIWTTFLPEFYSIKSVK